MELHTIKMMVMDMVEPVEQAPLMALSNVMAVQVAIQVVDIPTLQVAEEQSVKYLILQRLPKCIKMYRETEDVVIIVDIPIVTMVFVVPHQRSQLQIMLEDVVPERFPLHQNIVSCRKDTVAM